MKFNNLFHLILILNKFLRAPQTHSVYGSHTYLQVIGPKEQDQIRVAFLDGGLTSTLAILFSEISSCLRRDALQLGDHGNMLSSAEVSVGQP